MIIVSTDLDEEVKGTSDGDLLIGTAWRGGFVVVQNLDITTWSLTWDATSDSQVRQGRATLTVADPDGTLSPWGLGDALSPGGSRVQLAWVSGSSGIRVPLGMWRIRSANPSENWRTYTTPTGVALRVAGGGTVTLSLEEDVSATAALSRIDGDAPVSSATAITEMKRLLADCGSVDANLAPADKTIPPQYTAWPESRTDAIGDLLDMINAVCRVNGDGSLTILPRAGIGPVWTIQGGEDGVLIACDRKLNDDGVYNACRSSNSSTDGSMPLVARSYVTSGPLAYGGPFGKVPIFHQAIATTQGGVQDDAVTYLAQKMSAGMVDLTVTCLAHPALQVQDIVTILAPTVAGDLPLMGRVVAKSWQSANGVPGKSMTLTVRVTTETLEAIAERARRG